MVARTVYDSILYAVKILFSLAFVLFFISTIAVMFDCWEVAFIYVQCTYYVCCVCVNKTTIFGQFCLRRCMYFHHHHHHHIYFIYALLRYKNKKKTMQPQKQISSSCPVVHSTLFIFWNPDCTLLLYIYYAV